MRRPDSYPSQCGGGARSTRHKGAHCPAPPQACKSSPLHRRDGCRKRNKRQKGKGEKGHEAEEMPAEQEVKTVKDLKVNYRIKTPSWTRTRGATADMSLRSQDKEAEVETAAVRARG